MTEQHHPLDGNAAQIRLIADQIADTAITRFTTAHPQQPRAAEIPPPLKWAAAMIGALFTMGLATLCFWIVSTLSEMQVTVARIDERQQSQSGDTSGKFTDIERRISNLEAFHRSGAK